MFYVVRPLLPTGTAARNATAIMNKKAGIKRKYAMFGGNTIVQKMEKKIVYRPSYHE